MAVSVSFRPAIFPRASGPDKRFPIGYWYAAATLAGDASAGAATYTMAWSVARPDLIFSIAAVSYTEDQNVSRGVGVRVLTEQLAAEGVNTIFAIGGTSLAVANVPRCFLQLSLDTPFFKAESGTAWSVVIETNNPGAGFTGRVSIHGQLWDSQGLREPGFPGLYNMRAVKIVD